MKKQRKEQEPEAVVTLRIWTYADALKAVPYFRSLVQSLRDRWLEMRQAQGHQKRLAERPGRPDRVSIIAVEDAGRDLERNRPSGRVRQRQDRRLRAGSRAQAPREPASAAKRLRPGLAGAREQHAREGGRGGGEVRELR